MKPVYKIRRPKSHDLGPLFQKKRFNLSERKPLPAGSLAFASSFKVSRPAWHVSRLSVNAFGLFDPALSFGTYSHLSFVRLSPSSNIKYSISYTICNTSHASFFIFNMKIFKIFCNNLTGFYVFICEDKKSKGGENHD